MNLPGMDVAGQVSEVGAQVTSVGVGDRVITIVVPSGEHGGYREDAVVPRQRESHQVPALHRRRELADSRAPHLGVRRRQTTRHARRAWAGSLRGRLVLRCPQRLADK